MKNNIKLIIYLVVYIIALSGFYFSTDLWARFLDNNATDYNEWLERKREANKIVKGYPPNIATDIRIEPLKGFDNAVKITWNLSRGSDDSFILARSSRIPDTAANALKAFSLKIFKPDEERRLIDYNLSPGKYYYLILAQEKVTSKNIELYANENYTSSPLVIVNQADKKPGYLPQVKGIKAILLDRKSIYLSWRSLKNPGVIYSIYRASEPLSFSIKFNNAVRIGTVTDSDFFTDATVSKSGIYYYAVSTRSSMGKEDLELIANESYTKDGITIAMGEVKKGPGEIVYNPLPIIPKKELPDIPEIKKEVIDISDLDRILDNTFFKGKYKLAISQLKYFIHNTSTGDENLKARLFLGRAYLEIKYYRTALKYLINKNVKKRFPVEATFWRDYCLMRLR